MISSKKMKDKVLYLAKFIVQLKGNPATSERCLHLMDRGTSRLWLSCSNVNRIFKRFLLE